MLHTNGEPPPSVSTSLVATRTQEHCSNEAKNAAETPLSNHVATLVKAVQLVFEDGLAAAESGSAEGSLQWQQYFIMLVN